MAGKAQGLLVLGLLLAGAPAPAQQNFPPPTTVPTLYFAKDPAPPPSPPAPVTPPSTPAAKTDQPKSAVRFLPRALFLRKDTPDVPLASPPASLHFTKEAPVAPGAPPVVAPPALHFTKDAPKAPTAPAPAPAFYFSNDAPRTSPYSSPGPALHFTKDAPPVPPPAPTGPALHFTKEPAPRSSGLPLGREVPPHLLPASGVVQVAMQQANPPPLPAVPEDEAYQIQLIPPGAQRWTRLESEEAWRARMHQEARQRGQRIDFPPEPVVSTESYNGRNFPPATEVVEPGYVCYGRLFFEERNAERYDWDFGIIQPLVSAGYFYKDVLLFPYHYFTDPCRKFDCDAGYCLPGDPVPYLLYPPALSLTGLIGEAGAVLTVLALLPG